MSLDFSPVDNTLSPVKQQHEVEMSELLQGTPTKGTDLDAGGRLKESQDEVKFEFKITGMTCVACSGSIERLITNEFTSKGLLQQHVGLLTHKMILTFKSDAFITKKVTPEMICSEIEDIGFGCELLSIVELSAQLTAAKKRKRFKGQESDRSNSSIESQMGPEDEEAGNHPETPEKVQQEEQTIKRSKLKVESTQVNKDLLEEEIGRLEGVIHVSYDAKLQILTVSFRAKNIGLRSIITHAKEFCKGEVTYVPDDNDKGDIREILQQEVMKYRNRFLVSLMVLIPILIFMWVVPYAAKSFLTSFDLKNGVTLYILIICVLSSIIQFFMGAPFYTGAYKSVRHGSANMDVLVVLGTTAAWLYGVILIFMRFGIEEEHETPMKGHMRIHEHAHNFEISASLITVILLGKYLESFSKKQTVDKLSQLASLKATKAFLLQDGKTAKLQDVGIETDIDLLDIGDFIKVNNGTIVPIDGMVVLGSGLCNESMLTGESKPVQKSVGVKIYGGTMLTMGSVIVRVDKLNEQSTINQIMKLVESAQSSKAPIQGVADKIAKYFVPMIVILSILTSIFWFSYVYSAYSQENLYTGEKSHFVFAFNFGISTLVIACPCALGLATPTAVMVGTGIAAGFGVLIKGGDVLERINNITMVVFDKTGTLTAGAPILKDKIDVKAMFKVDLPEDQSDLTFDDLLALTYLTESSSEHPLAKAIVKDVVKLLNKNDSEGFEVDEEIKFELENFQNLDGEGVSANVVSKSDKTSFKVYCGNDKLMDRFGVDLEVNQLRQNMESLEKEGKTVVCLAIGQTPRLVLSLEEEHLAKSEAKCVVAYMANVLKLKVGMITGDNKHTALKVAKYLDIPIENVKYRAYPNEKKKTVQGFQNKGERVMFVGDGVNDSPVLAQADVGVAINAVSDITVQAAGIVVMKDRLDDVLNAIRISKATFFRIKLNFGWAFVYNCVLVPIAMGVLYPIGYRNKCDPQPSEGLQLDPMWAGAAMALSSVSVIMSSLFLKRFKTLSLPEIEALLQKAKPSQVTSK